MPVKGGEIEVAALCDGVAAQDLDPSDPGIKMGGTGKKRALPGKDKRKSRKPPPKPVGDGDIATPKRDRCRDDDQPL